jgi:hypothetical protein
MCTLAAEACTIVCAAAVIRKDASTWVTLQCLLQRSTHPDVFIGAVQALRQLDQPQQGAIVAKQADQ